MNDALTLVRKLDTSGDFPGLDDSRPITPKDVELHYATDEGFLIENFLMIADRTERDVPFVLNAEQRRLDYRIAQRRQAGLPIKFFIPKARRRGISAYITARFTVQALTKRNINGAVVAHRQKETDELFEKVDYYVRNHRGATPKLGTDSTVKISFPETNSKLGVFTAGSKDVARGLDCNRIHLSEAAYYASPKSLVSSLVETIPGTGEVFIESTGNGQGTWYHNRCSRIYYRGPDDLTFTDYDCMFFPWHLSPDTQQKLSPDEADALRADLPNPLFEEEELLKMFPTLPLERIAWRRKKIDEHDYDLWSFKQEHPMIFEECFIPTARSFFHKYIRIPTPRWTLLEPGLYALKEHPHPSYHYAMGVDVAAGIGQDRSVIQIICLETGEQVLEWTRDNIPPDEFPLYITELGEIYSWPLCVVESNNHGIVTIERLTNDMIYPSERIYWDDTTSRNIVRGGFRTTRATKPLWLGHLRRALAQEELVIYSEELAGELGTFTADMKAAEGAYDDRVMALAMALISRDHMYNYIVRNAPEVPRFDPIHNPFSFGNVFMEPTREGQPLASQAEARYPTIWN